MSERLAVNEHYLDRLVEAAAQRGVEATEDIVSGSGVKLVAKGAAIDARTRERLLQHKLLKPLEMCTRIVGGVGSRPMDEMARSLIHRHALLAGLCSGGCAEVIERAFMSLRLSPPLESLLTLYADQAPHKLEHAVSVSLMAGALMLTVEPTRALEPLLVAGLLHDVGELYIDPAILALGDTLSTAQWKHVAVHPVLAANLLTSLPGAGPTVAQAVLHHHERMDGSGYPRSLRGEEVPLSGQVLGLAETLAAIIEAGGDAGRHASVMLKLMGREFDRRLLDRVSCATPPGALAPLDAAATPRGAELHLQAADMTSRLLALQGLPGTLDGEHCSMPMAELLDRAQERQHGLLQTLFSAGLDQAPDALPDDDDGPAALQARYEAAIVLDALDARLQGLQRDLVWRAERLDAAEREQWLTALMRHLPTHAPTL